MDRLVSVEREAARTTGGVRELGRFTCNDKAVIVCVVFWTALLCEDVIL